MYPKSINKLLVNIERIRLEKYLRPINMAKKKRLKKVGEVIVFRELISKEGQISETNLPKRLVIKDTLIFLELLSFDLTILKRRKM